MRALDPSRIVSAGGLGSSGNFRRGPLAEPQSRANDFISIGNLVEPPPRRDFVPMPRLPAGRIADEVLRQGPEPLPPQARPPARRHHGLVDQRPIRSKPEHSEHEDVVVHPLNLALRSDATQEAPAGQAESWEVTQNAEHWKLAFNIDGAELVRIFDFMKSHQDVYTQILWMYEGGEEETSVEKLAAKTGTCSAGDKTPQWNERFLLSRAGAKWLKFQVKLEHYWRLDPVCGEAVIHVETLWNAARSCAPGECIPGGHLPLHKNGEKTGELHLVIEVPKIGETDARRGSDSPSNMVHSLADVKDVCQLLNNPAQLEEIVRGHFKRHAVKSGWKRKAYLRPGNLEQIARSLAQELRADPEVFGDDMTHMFWRFDFDGDQKLDEEESTQLFIALLQRYRDTLKEGSHGVLQLGVPEGNLRHKFEIDRELGRGAQGIVYLAINRQTQQENVVKLYSKSNPMFPAEEITKEFFTLVNLRHPNIARVYDIFQDYDNVYLVQEPYFGGDLTHAIEKAVQAGVSVDEPWLARVLDQVLTGVEYLHHNQVLHCDLKEANIMVARASEWQDPDVIVIDFGLANKFSSKSGSCGTPGYMPPEVWDDGLWTCRGDVFSIGVILYSMIFGQGPFVMNCRSTHDVEHRTKTFEPQWSFGSPELIELGQAMMQKSFHMRPNITNVRESHWIKGRAIHQWRFDQGLLDAMARKRDSKHLYKAVLKDAATRENLAQFRLLNQMFLQLDTNRDGSISAEEMRQALQARNWDHEIIHELISHLMDTQEGSVNYEEFIINLLCTKKVEEDELLQRIFHEVDEDNSGYLTVDELAHLLQRPAVQQVLGDRSPQELLLALDINHDGVVSYQEFKSAMHGDHRDEPWLREQHSAVVYQKGQPVLYESKHQRTLVPCFVTDVDEVTHAIQVSCRPGRWIRGQELKRVQPDTESQVAGIEEGLQEKSSLRRNIQSKQAEPRLLDVDRFVEPLLQQNPLAMLKAPAEQIAQRLPTGQAALAMLKAPAEQIAQRLPTGQAGAMSQQGEPISPLMRAEDAAAKVINHALSSGMDAVHNLQAISEKLREKIGQSSSMPAPAVTPAQPARRQPITVIF